MFMKIEIILYNNRNIQKEGNIFYKIKVGIWLKIDTILLGYR